MGIRSFAAAWPPAVKVLLAVCAFVTLSANSAFFAAALREHAFSQPATWGFALALAVGVFALHLLLASLLLAVLPQRLHKAALAVVLIAAALAGYFVQQYGVVLDPGMLQNVVNTDFAETRELLTPTFALHVLLYGVVPLALLWRTPMPPVPWRRALAWRLLLPVGAALLAVACLLSIFQPFSAVMRNQRSLRYMLTPANVMWSLGAVAQRRLAQPPGERRAIGLDAAPGPAMTGAKRPRVLVLVVGETARAANWGLNGPRADGSVRQTTPELSRLPVLNFADTTACGTSTEVSLPCMFAPVGRRDYDEARIKHSESLLHVLARGGVKVQWRDNQSGCKGVCAGLPADEVASLNVAGLCSGERCLDEGLVGDLDERLRALIKAGTSSGGTPTAPSTQIWVLHMLGSHGPSYFRRYPPAFERFKPTCTSDDLRGCAVEHIANAYDNSLLYTDHVLATAIRTLQSHAGAVDGALVFISDHGESLGEAGLFLHGMPFPIAPDVQKKVPFVVWLGDGFAAGIGLDLGCLRARSEKPAAHDHLFHTVLSLLDVRTALHEAAFDLTDGCRAKASAALPAAPAVATAKP